MSELYNVGKFVVAEYPEEYQLFVTELLKNHKDLAQAMDLANCRIEDGTALDFLNKVLGTQVTMRMPMSDGYAILLFALKRRQSAMNLKQTVDTMRVDNEFDIFGNEKLTYDQLFLSKEELGK